jgi:hypothetical protein
MIADMKEGFDAIRALMEGLVAVTHVSTQMAIFRRSA